MSNPLNLDEQFARKATDLGMVTPFQIDLGRQTQQKTAKDGSQPALSQILIDIGAITPIQSETLLKIIKSDDQEELGIKTLGQYQLFKQLGKGGMGSVYLAQDTMMDRKVAIKVLSGEHVSDEIFLSRFQKEARSAGKLNHENIATAYAVGEELGQHFYVMEYCPGESLGEKIRREFAIPWKEAVEIIRKVARGLGHAHKHGLVHRDIKPENIMIAEDGSVKILDLGLVKNLGSSGDSTFLTETGFAIGTPYYFSPEQARGAKDLDGRSDIYSLGATFFHLITGKLPYSGSSPAAVALQHINDPIPDPRLHLSDIPYSVVRVIQRMLAKNPEERYVDCYELLKDLDHVGADLSSTSMALEAMSDSVDVYGETAALPAASDAHQKRPAPRPPIGKSEPKEVPQTGSPTHRYALYVLLAVAAVTGLAAFAQHLLTEAPAPTSEPASPGPKTFTPTNFSKARSRFKGEIKTLNPKSGRISLSYDFNDTASLADWVNMMRWGSRYRLNFQSSPEPLENALIHKGVLKMAQNTSSANKRMMATLSVPMHGKMDISFDASKSFGLGGGLCLSIQDSQTGKLVQQVFVGSHRDSKGYRGWLIPSWPTKIPKIEKNIPEKFVNKNSAKYQLKQNEGTYSFFINGTAITKDYLVGNLNERPHLIWITLVLSTMVPNNSEGIFFENVRIRGNLNAAWLITHPSK